MIEKSNDFYKNEKGKGFGTQKKKRANVFTTNLSSLDRLLSQTLQLL